MIAETWTARAKPGTWSNGCRFEEVGAAAAEASAAAAAATELF